MPKTPVITCGIYLYDKHSEKILICHPTDASWKSWSIPKGLKDEGEESFIAAARELKEETGIDLLKLSILKTEQLPAVKYKKQNKVLESFLVITETSLEKEKLFCDSLTPKGKPEIDKWAWVEPSVISEKAHESQAENINLILRIIQNAKPIY
ncbi:MAG: hydrolase [Bacteroidota bacterium]|jgi:8-oxo-dGTP pyrophosphatase MutT (NUDIX family)|nr:hydrolase [Bacteroidota bacterium]